MGLFSKIFKTDKSVRYGTNLEWLDSHPYQFSNYDGKLYRSAEIRACIDAIARNGAKLNPKHIRAKNGNFQILDNRISRLIGKQPNELMNAYDFYYKIISLRELNNNAFIFIQRDENGLPSGLYPIDAHHYKLVEYRDNVYIQFEFRSGKVYTASLKDDVIHLRKHFCDNEILGDTNEPIVKVMSLKHIIDEGIIGAIKSTQSIKGLLKSTKAMLKPEDIKAMRDRFVDDFITSQDGTGIASIDATMDFIPVKIDPQTATDKQLDVYEDKVLNYFGISKEVLQSKYSEDQWNAFYESVLEPIAIEMGMEFTNKLFSVAERDRGNEIIFESNRLQYASITSKIAFASQMQNYVTINEMREVFNLAPVDDGDKILQDLNKIDSSIANQVQGGNE